MTLTNTINDRLRKFLEEKQMTVVEFARLSGLSKDNLYKWIKGTRPSDPVEYNKLDEFLTLESIPDSSRLDGTTESEITTNEIKYLDKQDPGRDSKINVFLSYSAQELGDILKDYIRLVKKYDFELTSSGRSNSVQIKNDSRKSASDLSSDESLYKTKYMLLLETIKDVSLNKITLDDALKMFEDEEPPL